MGLGLICLPTCAKRALHGKCKAKVGLTDKRDKHQLILSVFTCRVATLSISSGFALT